VYTASSVTKLNSLSTSRASFAATKAEYICRITSASVAELVEVVGVFCRVSWEQATQTSTSIKWIRRLTLDSPLERNRRCGLTTIRSFVPNLPHDGEPGLL
jgi:hypothetical protein